MPNTIVLTGGGSGGHITPLLSLARAVKRLKPDIRIVYIGLKGEKISGLSSDYSVFDEVHFVSAGKFRRYHGEKFTAQLMDFKTLLQNIRDFFRVIIGLVEAYLLLGKIKPLVVFSKGGFVAVPVGLGAKIRSVPILTHDSDAVPGLANRIIGRWATAHAVGMPKGEYPYNKESTFFVGIPTDERLKLNITTRQAKIRLGLPTKSVVLLIAGGGLGSQQINMTIAKIAPKLLQNFANLHIFHITGSEFAQETKNRYHLPESLESRLHLIGFSSNFYELVTASDLILSRAGATALAEYAVAAKPLIIMPASHLTGGHQLHNAHQLKQKNAAVVISDDSSPGDVYSQLRLLLEDKAARDELSKNISLLAVPDSADKTAHLLLQVANLMQSTGHNVTKT